MPAPKKRLQVFVSSTYIDMKSERQAAVEAILEAGHIPAGMELFAANNESQLKTIHRWIDDSDVFMLILGGRYGSIEAHKGKSYIELEYEYAVKLKKPFFAAAIDDATLEQKVIHHGSKMKESDNGQLLKEFRKQVTSRMCGFFGDMNKLKLIVHQSLGEYERDESLSGWVRGNDVPDAKSILEQVSRLQAENDGLRKELALAESQDVFSRSLSDDAKVLLFTACDGDGYLSVGQSGGTRITVKSPKENKRFQFVKGKSGTNEHAREESRWVAAVQELVAAGMLIRVGTYASGGEDYRATKNGFTLFDKENAPAETAPSGDA